MDKEDYILEYKNFYWNEIGAMMKYLNYTFTQNKTQNIRITRWNDKNERA